MELLAEAVERVGSRRARYEWEPAHLVGRPAWLYPPAYWSDPAHALGPRHDDLRAELGAEIDGLLDR